MSTFKSFLMGMSTEEREQYATRAGTSTGQLNQIVYAGREIELGLADVLVALAPAGSLSLDDLPLTDRAQKQRAIREAAGSLSCEAQRAA